MSDQNPERKEPRRTKWFVALERYYNHRWSGGVALVLAAVLLALTGIAPAVGNFFSHDLECQLGDADLPIRPELGHAYLCDLSSLDIANVADANEVPSRSNLILLEDGRPLKPHTLHDNIRYGTGGFSHWGPTIYFAATDGSNPATNGKTYVIRYQVASSWLLEFVTSQSFALATLFLLTLASLIELGRDTPFAKTLGSRWSLAGLALGLACSLFFQVGEIRNKFGVSPDSDSYTERPGMSSRPPLYYAFMSAVSDPAVIRAETAELGKAGNSNRILEGPIGDPIVRVILGQKILLVVTFMVAFAALAACLPCPLAAAVVLLISQMANKPPAAIVPISLATVIMIAPAMVALIADKKRVSGTKIVQLILLILVLRPILWTAFCSTLVSAQINMLLSEPLAMATHVAFMAALVLYLMQARVQWLYVAALLTGAAFLVRPASIFILGTLVMAALLSLAWRQHPKLAHIVLSLACALALCLIPGIVKRIAHARNQDVSMMKWAMAAFALGVAEPGDAAKIQDKDARRLLLESLQAKAKYRSEVVIPVDGAFDDEIIHLGYYTYSIVLPLSQKISCEKFPDGSPEQLKERHRLLGEMAFAIYKAHPLRLLNLYVSSYHYMVGRGTRLSNGQPFWLTLLGAVILALWTRNRLALTGMALCGAHLIHLLVISVFDQPLDRYVYATEFFPVVGICLIVWGALNGLVSPGGKKATPVSVQHDPA